MVPTLTILGRFSAATRGAAFSGFPIALVTLLVCLLTLAKSRLLPRISSANSSGPLAPTTPPVRRWRDNPLGNFFTAFADTTIVQVKPHSEGVKCTTAK